MDRDTPTSPHPGTDAVRPRAVDRARVWAGVEDWLTEDALAAAATAEEELALDWARYCARRRHGAAPDHGLRPTGRASLRRTG